MLIRNVVREEFLIETKLGEENIKKHYILLGYVFHPSTKNQYQLSFRGMLQNAMIPFMITNYHSFENEYLEICVPEVNPCDENYENEINEIIDNLSKQFDELDVYTDSVDAADEKVVDEVLFSDDSGGLANDSSGALELIEDDFMMDSVTLGEDEDE